MRNKIEIKPNKLLKKYKVKYVRVMRHKELKPMYTRNQHLDTNPIIHLEHIIDSWNKKPKKCCCGSDEVSKKWIQGWIIPVLKELCEDLNIRYQDYTKEQDKLNEW